MYSKIVRFSTESESKQLEKIMPGKIELRILLTGESSQ